MLKVNNLLVFPHKKIRAELIKEYLNRSRYDKVVCFSCGNAAREIKEAGIDTLFIGEDGELKPNEWFTQLKIDNIFPKYFNATSGHLPIELMQMLSERYKTYLGELSSDVIYVPTGSGETIICLKIAYPHKKFVAVYNLDNATKYDNENPLNCLVEIIADKVLKNLE